MPNREVKTFCRICVGYCGLALTIDDQDKIVKMRGDKENPMSMGYACIKGLESGYSHQGPDRILKPLKRMPDGSYEEIASEQALDEIAEKLEKIIERDGPDAVAIFKGSNAYQTPLPSVFLTAFQKAIGTTSLFSTMTIDQSAKMVSADRIGSWEAGRNYLAIADTLIIFGANPLLSVSMFGFDCDNPQKRLKEFKNRGGRLIVIDPRRTETAKFADIHIQPRPNEDITIAAGMIRLILSQGMENRDFCRKHVTQLEELRQAVEPFTPEYVSERAGIDADLLRSASKIFSESDRAFTLSGTGPNMSPHSNLAQHFIDCLDVVRGNFLREGDPVANPGLQGQPLPRAQVVAPGRCWEKSQKSRVRGLGTLLGEKMTGALAEEITTPGTGQIKAMIVGGGNPGSSIPDQKRVIDAFRSLELLVTIDPEMTNTAKIAHYIIPPKLMFEHPNVRGLIEFETLIFQRPGQQFAAPAIATPPGSDVVDDWYVFWSLAKRLGKQLYFNDIPLDMKNKPDDEYLLDLLFRNSPVNLEDLKKYPSGHVFSEIKGNVQPPLSDANGKFEVAPKDVLTELKQVLEEYPRKVTIAENDEPCDLLLISRRLRHVFNSTGRSPKIRKSMPYNAAYLHPDELKARNLSSGDHVIITSDNGSIPAIVEEDDTLRNGIVSMSHSWGSLPGETNYVTDGSSTGLLVSSVRDCEKINAMPRMSSIPVNINSQERQNCEGTRLLS